jgi:hypothetical protein
LETTIRPTLKELLPVQEIRKIAIQRFNLIAAIVGEVQGRVIVTLFYYTILVPFGLGSRLFSDPLHRKQVDPKWHHREPVPRDLDSAKQQG